MTGSPRAGAKGTTFAVLLLVLLLLSSESSLGIPGDLQVQMSMDEDDLEAAPEERADTVLFHGNVTFEQPFYQYAAAQLTADLGKNWSVAITPGTVTNRGSGPVPFTVSVEVPPTAVGREVATINILCEYATRFGDPRTTSDSVRVRVKPWIGYNINLTGPAELVLPQGGSGKLSVPVRNVGNEAETFSSNVPYWYGLRSQGLVVEGPSGIRVPAKGEVILEFHVSVSGEAVPRTYALDLMVDASSLPKGGVNTTGDPRQVPAMVYVTGNPPPDDPYGDWQVGDPPGTIPSWGPIISQPSNRANPDIDPSGKQMVFDETVGDDRVIYVRDISGSGARRLTHGNYDHHPVYSPNGQMIAFARAPDRILVINQNGTELMEFGTELGNVNLTDWSPSGERLLLDAGGNIYELDLRTNVTYRLAGDPVRQWGGVYAPDGSRIFYLSFEAAGVHDEVFSMRSDGSSRAQLTFNDLAERSVAVSPNGRKLAFALSGPNNGADRLCVMGTDGSDVRPFTDRSRHVNVVRWFPDGKALVAEAGPVNSTNTDLFRVAYPWNDAGFPDDDGGDGGPGGTGDTIWERVSSYMTPWTCSTAILVVVIVALLFVYQRRRRRSMAEAAERLIELQELREATDSENGMIWTPEPAVEPSYGGRDGPY